MCEPQHKGEDGPRLGAFGNKRASPAGSPAVSAGDRTPGWASHGRDRWDSRGARQRRTASLAQLGFCTEASQGKQFHLKLLFASKREQDIHNALLF